MNVLMCLITHTFLLLLLLLMQDNPQEHQSKILTQPTDDYKHLYIHSGCI